MKKIFIFILIIGLSFSLIKKVEAQSSSADFQVNCQQLDQLGVGSSISSGYTINHGLICVEQPSITGISFPVSSPVEGTGGDIIGSIRDFIQSILDFLNSSDISKFIPVAIGAAILTLASIASTSNLFGILLGILIPRKKRNWGVVFDVSTSEPIPFVTVKAVNQSTNQVYQTISDIDGSYGILLEELGDFTLSAQIGGYQNFLKNLQVMDLRNEIIEDIPMQKVDVRFSIKGVLARNRLKLVKLLNYSLLILMIIGLIYTIYATYISPVLLNFIMLAIYFLLIIINIIIFIRTNFISIRGRVQDSATKLGIPAVSTRFYDVARQIIVALTNKNGEIKVNLKKGKYMIRVNKSGYQFLETKLGNYINVTKGGTLEENIFMQRIAGQKLPAESELLESPFAKQNL